MKAKQLESKLIRIQEKLKRWNRKLKLAQTKTRDLKLKIKYYEKKLLESHGVSTVQQKSAVETLKEFLDIKV